MRTFVLFLALILTINLSSCVARISRPAEQVTVIKTPPKNYKIVRVNGKRYYTWNGKHYRKTRKGFVFVKVNKS